MAYQIIACHIASKVKKVWFLEAVTTFVLGKSMLLRNVKMPKSPPSNIPREKDAVLVREYHLNVWQAVSKTQLQSNREAREVQHAQIMSTRLCVVIKMKENYLCALNILLANASDHPVSLVKNQLRVKDQQQNVKNGEMIDFQVTNFTHFVQVHHPSVPSTP